MLVSTAVCDLLTDTLAISDRLTDCVNDIDRDIDLDKDMVLDSDGNCVTLRDNVTDTDILAGTLREPLGVGCTDNDGVILNPNDAERDGLAIFDEDTVIDLDIVLEIVMDLDIDSVAVNEHDLNNGLHDRVTLEEGALLRETVLLAEGDFVIPNWERLAETLADTLRDACIDNVGVRLDPKDMIGELLTGCDRLGDRVTLLELLCDFDIVRVSVKA